MSKNMVSPTSPLDSARAAVRAGRYVKARYLSKSHALYDPQSVPVWSLLGTIAVAQGDHTRALVCFRRATQAAETINPRILMNLGRAHYLSRQLSRAEAAFKAAIKQNPEYYQAHYELARLYLEALRVGQAVPHMCVVATLAPIHWSYFEVLKKHLTTFGHWLLAVKFEAVLAIRGGLNEENWVNLLKAANMAADFEAVRAAMRQLLILSPKSAIVWKAIDAPHLVKGIRNEMLLVFRAAAISNPIGEVRLLRWAYYFRVHNDLSGMALVAEAAERLGIHHPRLAAFRAWLHVKSGDLPALEVLVNKFVKTESDDVYAWNELGLVIQSVHHYQQTRKFYRLASRRFPTQLDIMHNYAQAEVDCDNLVNGRRLARQILVQNPTAVRSMNILGVVEGSYDKLQTAINLFNRYLIVVPDSPQATLNLGLHLAESGDRSGALRFMRRAIDLSDGDNPQAAYNLALELLAGGEIIEGYRHYRMRWRADRFLPEPRPLPQAEWPGPVVAPRPHLAVYMEQGMGDEVMYSWYLPLLEADTRSLTVECDRRLVTIFERSFPRVSFIPREDPLHSALKAPTIEYQSAIASVPEFYATALNHMIRAQQASPERLCRREAPRLTADPERLAHWRHYLKVTFGTRPCLGVVWRSALRNHKRDKQYVTPRQMVGALPAGVGVINLQYSYDAEEADAFSALGARHGFQFETPPEIDLKDDLDDLFALIQCLDGVVGPLISVPWMAAAVGTPAFVFRTEAKGYIWQQLNTPYIPWAPSMRLFFRAPTAPWGTVLGTVKQVIARELFPPI